MTETIQTLKEHNIFSKDYCYLTMWFRTRQSYTIKQVSEVLNVSERVAENYVEKLEQAGLIELGKRADRKTRQKMADIEKPQQSDALSLRFAHYVWRRLTALHPDNLELKKAFVDNWTKDAELLLKERKPKDANEIFEYAIGDDFWKNVVLSVGSFRKQYDKIQVKTKATQPQVQVSTKYLSDD